MRTFTMFVMVIFLVFSTAAVSTQMLGACGDYAPENPCYG